MKKAPALMVCLRIFDKHILQVRLGDPEFLDAHPPRLEQAEEDPAHLDRVGDERLAGLALLVAVGKTYCHSRQPDCAACPLGPELEATHA